MSLLLLSLAVLWSSPWLYALVHPHARLNRLLERSLLLVLAGLVLFSIMPEAWRIVGPWSLAVALVGLILPSVLERAWRRLADRVHWVPLALGTLGLALHASLDGAAFVEGGHHDHVHMHALPYAVVVHRFFEGLFVWWTLRRFNVLAAAGALVFISLFTLFGYAAGDLYFHELEDAIPFGVFQALVAGSLMHLVFDRHGPHDHGAGGAHHHHDHGVDHPASGVPGKGRDLDQREALTPEAPPAGR